MPKLKTKGALKKRFKVTKTGKIMRQQAYKSHLSTGKSRNRKRRLRKATVASSADKQNIRRLLPYA